MTGAGSCRRCARPLLNPQRCGACGEFQPHDPRRDVFATLALERGFRIDEAGLERRVVEFGRELHPDLAGAEARARAVLGAAQLHEAYAIVRDPLRRAEHLLAAAGGASASQDKSVPDGFLEQMLEEREALERALSGGDAAISAERERLRSKLAELEAGIGERFDELARAADRGEVLRALRRTLNVMAYYCSLERDLREALRERAT